MLKWKALMSVSAAILVLAAVQAQQKGTKGPGLTALDYVEIQQLYARYSHGVDSGADNGAAFTRAFAPDGALIAPTGSTEGHAKLAELATRGNKGPTNVRHWATNVLIEPSPEGATGSAYVLLVSIGEAGKPSTVTGGGIYRDVFVKGPDGWRIKKRNYFPANSIPGPQAQSQSAR